MKKFLIVATLLLALPPTVSTQQEKSEACYCNVKDPWLVKPPPAPSPTPTPSPDQCDGVRVIYRQNEVDKKARITAKPEPRYTTAGKEKGVTGTVRLRAVLCPSGAVSHISVIRGLSDGLTEEAINAAQHIEYEPAEKDDQKVAQYVVLEYSFEP